MINPIQIITGVIAGAIGAAIWAAIAYYGKVEIGYVAIGVGALVGFGVALAGKNSTLAGATAAVITIASLLGGKYATVELSMQEGNASIEEAIADFKADANEETFVASIADDIASSLEEKGENLDWPPGMSYENASGQADYPKDVWQQASLSWKSLSDQEKEEYQQECLTFAESNYRQRWADISAEARQEGFFATFSPLDLLFFAIAIGAAWSIASKAEEENAEEADPLQPADQFPPPIE